VAVWDGKLKPFLDQRKIDVDAAMKRRSMGTIGGMIGEKSLTRGFLGCLTANFVSTGRIGLVAEFKKAAPVVGLINPRADLEDFIYDITEGGASCLSVAVDRQCYRGGSADLVMATQAAAMPILARDLVIDPYQILEARLNGADAVVLSPAILGDRLAESLAKAANVALDVVVEARSADEIAQALDAGARMICVDNRDLETWDVDFDRALSLLPLIPADRALALASGGIADKAYVDQLAARGAKAMIVGEALMRVDDAELVARSLLGLPPPVYED
jgi:indole-3-glycerol phosphate synthase